MTRSALYETAPVGPVDQPLFLNAVAVFDTDEEPTVALAQLLAGERARGRTRDVRWGPRTLDLDLLLYETRIFDVPGLTVPHPELANRRFVLEPLLEAWPEATLPDGTPISTMLGGVANQEVRRVGPWGIPRWKSLWWALLRARRPAAGSR
jgi:2-amino-4-hydroxy-6-hydroxymethyldihydropteridine diphosphokinase